MPKDNQNDDLKEILASDKKNVEDTHVRTTFLLEEDLAKRLNRLAAGKRGFKSLFFNRAVKNLLDELEE